MSIFDKLLDGYVTIESAKLNSRLSTQPQQQAASLADIPVSSNVKAAAPVTAKPFYTKPAFLIGGAVVVVVVVFAAAKMK